MATSPGARKTAKSPSDEELLARISEGEESAFNLLYERYFKRVYGFVSRRMGNRADIEEVTQEIFISVLSSLDSYRGESVFSAWLFGLSRRVVANRFKRKRHITVPLLDDEGTEMLSPASLQITPLDEYECTERFRQLTTTMDRMLSEEQKILFRLHHIEDRPISEIARKLSKTEDAIKSNLYRTRRILLSRESA
ncbi:MAG: RNA polymerase sigma factor [Myxococcota bacterium]|nr:RNA polymerase sigma factor [Myxococcota bacterium]